MVDGRFPVEGGFFNDTSINRGEDGLDREDILRGRIAVLEAVNGTENWATVFFSILGFYF